MLKRLLSIALGISVCIGCAACGTAPNEAREEPVDAAPVEPAPSDGWSCIFAAAAQPSQIDVLPKNPHLSGSTCRQEFRASMAGSKIRLTFSNEHSATLDAPGQNLVIESVHVAKLLKAGEPDIGTSTDVAGRNRHLGRNRLFVRQSRIYRRDREIRRGSVISDMSPRGGLRELGR